MKTATILRKLREEKDLSQAEMAKILGLDKSTYCKYENGGSIKRSLEKLTSFFGVSSDYLLGMEDEAKRKRDNAKKIADAIYGSQTLQKLFSVAKHSTAKNIGIATAILEHLKKEDK